MVLMTAFAAGALVVTVITLVNGIERRAGSILDHLTATGVATWPMVDVVGLSAPSNGRSARR